MTKEAIRQIRNFNPENDLKIIEVLEDQLKLFLSEARNLQLNDKREEEQSPTEGISAMRNSLRLTQRNLSMGLPDQVSKETLQIANRLRIDRFKMD